MFKHRDIEIPRLDKVTVDGKRYYVTPTGEKYTSVTTFLGSFESKELTEWRNSVGEEKAKQISKRATTRGSAVHLLAEKYLNNIPVSLRDETNPIVKSLFAKLTKELDKVDNIYCIETPLFSNKLKLAGTVDCIAEYNGKLSIIDFKTSSRLKKKAQIENYFLQGCAYGIMFEELTGIKVDQICIIITIEAAEFCQVMKVNPSDYVEMLNNKLATYHERNASSTDEKTGKHDQGTETLC